MTQSLHLNERSTHSPDTRNFELESSVKPSQFTRRRRRRKTPKEEGNGEQKLNDEKDHKRSVADRGVPGTLQASFSPRVLRMEAEATVKVSNTAAKGNNDGTRFGDRWTHIESEGMSFREFKAQVKQVLYAPITTWSDVNVQ